MNVNQIIDGILDREKQGTPPYLVRGDAGGRTSWGISERAHPEAWKPGPPTRVQAAAIYRDIYVTPFFQLQNVAADSVITFLVDVAVMSSVSAAVQLLQSILDVPIDGLIGPQTVTATRAQRQARLLQQLVRARALQLARFVQRRPSDLTNIVGWLNRTLSFLPEVG